ncbi:hypothetical protein C2E20_8546 [Micractinium conductrix]|uniref:Uncharacterized protein n=1 Tax=Micractinium conductrix TaxID=554055 RepID=A0A2P6UZI0_9CHLO|nr:hypothetical protein C2E20_9079 [Micractinium conductrix]PSC67828.1 hypothetical protein C2E20_8546 [Micractinium conductrix]|eukprot:PSC67245.1 hypothetical protein C2E20_9079 [Micractinium conductrix]
MATSSALCSSKAPAPAASRAAPSARPSAWVSPALHQIGAPRASGTWAPRGGASQRGPAPARAWGQLRMEQHGEPEDHFRSLFSLHYIPPSNNPATAFDARDALEACGGLWGEERRECLSVFGLDAGQVDTFYTTVMALETALNQDTDPEEEASHRGLERC